jgi:hypothetical protein
MVDVRWFSGVVMLTTILACGESEESGEQGDGGARSGGGSTAAGGSTNGGTASGGTSGGGSANGGTAGGGTSSGGSSSGTGGGSGGIDCTGTFGAPRTLIAAPSVTLSSLTLSPDELELVYSAGSVTQGFFHARRASKADIFPDGVALPELDAACATAEQTRSGDLSFDGLRFYFTCYTSSESVPTPLRIARRASLDAPFVLDPMPLGNVLGGPSVSRDELELVSALADMPAMRYGRDDASASFDAGAPIAGFETLLMRTPELAPDDLEIFIAVSQGTATNSGLSSATRSGPGAPFGTPNPIVVPTVTTETFGSAAISNDCRSLYYVHIVSTMSPATYSVEVISR